MHSNPVLRDNFGRRFQYLRLSITERCNFRCDYCLPDGYQGGEESPLSLNEIRTAVRAFASCGTRKVRITGGEPGLRKDLSEIIAVCTSTPGIQTVAMTTNGYHLEHSIENWVNAGLNQINISIDSLDRARFAEITGHDRLSSIQRGIHRALALGLKVKINAVLMKGFNDTELVQFLEWIKETPVTVRFIELMQTGNQGVFFAEHHLSGEYMKQHLLSNGWVVESREAEAGPAIEMSHPDYQGGIGLILPYSPDFCQTCNRLRLSSVGKVHLCLFGEQGYDVREALSSENEQRVANQLRELLQLKHETHYLDDGKTGATQHFALLGG